jgi:hypothetical protein
VLRLSSGGCGFLRHQGVVVNNKKLRRLMRRERPATQRRYVATTDSEHVSIGPLNRAGFAGGSLV